LALHYSRGNFSIDIACWFSLFFFACPKKKQKKPPEKDYIPFSGWFPG
jgi:hypothetical protein